MPIIKEILEKITNTKPIDLDKLNIDMDFKIVWASFLHLGKITYISTKLKKALFSKTKVIKLNVFFAEDN